MNNQMNGSNPNIPVFDDMFDVWVKSWWQSPLVLCIFIIIGIGLLYGILCLYKKRQQRSIVVDPDTYAHEQLKNIECKLSQPDMNAHDVYTALLSVIKMYLDQKYKLTTCSKTECELYSYLSEYRKQVPNLNDWLSLIHSIQNNAIIAKFDRAMVKKEELTADYHAVKDIIARSKAVLFIEQK